MSLIPMLFSNWWEGLERPHSLFDQHFGLPMDPENLLDRLGPSSTEVLLYKPNRLQTRSSRYHPFLNSLMKRGNRGASTIKPDKDRFCVTLDINQFHPEEMNIKVVDNYVVVEAKHEEKEDEHGWISRQFVRKYLIPEQCDIDKIESHLSSDGILTITAPKKEPAKSDSNERVIKIQFTGEPAIAHHGENEAGNSQQREQNQQRHAAQRGKKSTVKAA